MDAAYLVVILICWASILGVWTIGFFGNKKTINIPQGFRQAIINTLLVAGFILLVVSIATPQTFGGGATLVSPPMSFFGTFLTLAGTFFAIWARITIGRNWSGAVITAKEHHQLVTDGPYRIVRHPIYTGLLMVALGAAVVTRSIEGAVGFLLILMALLSRIPQEELLMADKFPDAYSHYRRRTKKLIPFIW